MSLQNTPRLGLPLLQAGQAGQYITLNESLWRLEALVQAGVLSRALAQEPEAPAQGDAYILPVASTGAEWSHHDAGDFLVFWGGYWNRVDLPLGAIVFVADEGVHLVRVSGGFAALNAQQNLSHLGVNATADDYNRLSVSSPAVLFTHAGAGVQAKFNKNVAGDTASIVWQTGWSGRAEFGTAGNDNLSLKVSPDGARWLTAYEVNRHNGAVRFRSDRYKTANAVWRRHVSETPWRTSVSPSDTQWRGLCWAAELGVFCAVGTQGSVNRVMTSGDGVNWTARTSVSGNNAPNAVCWSAELWRFVAVCGSGSRVMTSPDGVNWTAATAAAANAWTSVCWSGELGLFCAVANSGTGNRVMASPDGANWTIRSSAADSGWSSVCWSGELGLFCAVAASGTGNRVMTSPDGVNWTARAAVANNWSSVCWSGELGLFCAVAASGTGNRVMTSPDGVEWTARISAADNNWSSVCWSGELGLFCAVAASGTGNRVMTSPNGVEWTVRTSAADNSWASVCWAGELGLFGAVSGSGGTQGAMTSVSAYSYGFRA